MGKWRYGSTILDLCARRMWVVSFTPPPFNFRGKSPLYPLDRRLGGPESRSVPCGAQNNLFPLLGIEPLPSSQTLYRLRWSGGTDENYETLLTVVFSKKQIISVLPWRIAFWQQCGRGSRRLSTAANSDGPVPAPSTSERHNVSSYDCLMLFSHLLRDLQNEEGLPRDFPNRIMHAFLACSIPVTSQHTVAPCISLFY
jgi:hypothetical protein